MIETVGKSTDQKFFVCFFCFLVIGLLPSILFSITESLGIVESYVIWRIKIEHGNVSGSIWRRVNKKRYMF
jgi:hypothetical protein